MPNPHADDGPNDVTDLHEDESHGEARAAAEEDQADDGANGEADEADDDADDATDEQANDAALQLWRQLTHGGREVRHGCSRMPAWDQRQAVASSPSRR